MIKILVVDDSPVMREFLVHILSSDPGMEVVATARNGEEAIEAARRLKPHIITMDIHMPGMDGFEATRKIMETAPTPVVIVTGSADPKEVATTFRAMEAGALMVLPRPAGLGHPDHNQAVKDLILNVKLMSEVKVVRRRPAKVNQRVEAPAATLEQARPDVQVVAIGASTGGPIVIHTILSKLPKDFPIPILIVQHMAPGFIAGFAEWLRESTGFQIHVAKDGELIVPGRAYLCPDGVHMGIGALSRIKFVKDEPEHGLRPSASYLFRSVASAFGKCAIGVLLTGMGRDGAAELKMMRERGAITFAQDRVSSIVFGMPGEAIKIDAATHVLPPEAIADELVRLIRRG